MGCNCGKPKCDGKCGISPAVLQINNPSECVIFHKVDVPASMGDSTTNPPKTGAYKNVLLYYEADQTSWLYSSDGIPVRLTNGITNYEDAINLPQINGETLIGDKSSADLKLADAPMVITIASGNTVWSGADTAEDIYNFFLNQGKVNVVFEGSENYGYEIVSAAYIPGEQKMMCMVVVASVDTGSSPVEFSGNALYGLMTFYTAGKAVDVGEIDLQPKLFVTDFTGLNIIDGNVLEGVPATGFSIGMVKPGDGLEVASDGTLSVNTEVTHTFDTVADMKASTVLKAGDVAQTLGFHTLNDGGGALYKVRSITNDDVVDEMFIIALSDNTLVAELIVNGELNIKQLGAYGDGAHDDTDCFQGAFSKNNLSVYAPTGTYLISESLEMPTKTTLYGDGSCSVIKAGADFGATYMLKVPYLSRHCAIKSLYIDGLHQANGIYDGYGDTVVATRLNMLDLIVNNCKTSIYLNSVGSTIHNCYIIGEYTLDNTGREQYGIYINSTDNMISDTRVACFTQYGVYCDKGSNKFSNVKCMLCGTGCYLKGENISGVVEAQENFRDNFKLYRVLDSNLTLNSSGAGVVEKVGDNIPTTLNNYSLIDIEECKSTIITMAGGIREVYGDTWSCEGNVITMTKSIGMDINANCYTHTDSTATPKMINADTITGNNVIVNGFKYFNNLKKTSVTLQGYSSSTLNYQDGDNYEITISAGASGGIGMLHFAYNNWNNISLFNAMSEGVNISQIVFRYTVGGTAYNIQLGANVARDITAECAMYRIVQDIASTLANDAQYQEFISQGATIENKEIQIQANLNNSHIASRNNIKGLIEVYTN